MEIGLWEAAKTGDLFCDAAWSNLEDLPGLPDADRQTLFRLITEESVRRSMADAENPVVLGAIMDPKHCVAFGANEHGGRIRLWAAPISHDRLYPLLRRWTNAAQVQEWRVRESQDPGFIQELKKRPDGEHLNPPAGFVRVPPLAGDSLSIALYEPNPIRRLLKCYKLALNMLEPLADHEPKTDTDRDDSDWNPIVLIDNLCDIATSCIQVAGLSSLVTREVPGWRIIDETKRDVEPPESSSSEPEEYEEVEAPPTIALQRSRLPALPADLHELKSLPTHDSIAAFCGAVGEALVECSHRSPDRDLDSLEAAVFCNPSVLSSESLRDALPAWMSNAALDPMIQSVVVARNPGAALKHGQSFEDWLASVRRLDLLDRIGGLVVAAQAAYDCSVRELEAGRKDRRPLLLLGVLVRAVEFAEEAQNEVTTGSEDGQWRQEPIRGGLVEVLDRLAELQIGCDQRRLLRIQALFRIALGMPTPDVVIRALHLALEAEDKHLDALVGSALTTDSPLMIDLAIFVIAERSTCDQARAREILRDRFCPSLPIDHDRSKPSMRTLAAAPSSECAPS